MTVLDADKLKRQVALALRSPKIAVWLFGERSLPLIEYIRELSTPKAQEDSP
jgi:hypothetical protein